MDKIFIRGLKVQTIIGIYDWERTQDRPLIFDLDLGTDIREAAASDRMRDSIDYAAIADTVTSIAQKLQPELLETLAEAIARELFQRFPILSLRLRIDKPGAIPTDGVGVEIERLREEYAVCGG